MSVCVMLLLLSDAVYSDSADEAPPMLSVTVVSATGEPIAGARVSVAARWTRSKRLVKVRFEADAKTLTAVTDARGVATIVVPDSETIYFGYVDAGVRGRGYADMLQAGRIAEIPVDVGPPLRIRLTNLPKQLRDGFIVEEVFEPSGYPVHIVHGPLIVDPLEPTIELPNPFGNRLVFGMDWKPNGDPVPLPRTLHINARGGKRVADVDFADPDSASYVDPLLAPARRTIRLRFRTLDDESVDVPSFAFAGKRFVSIEGTGFRPGYDAKPKQPQDLLFVQSGQDWLLRGLDSEQVALQFRETRLPDHVLVGDGDRFVPVGSGDRTINVAYTPTVEYRWDETATRWDESEYVRFSWASESLGSATQKLPTRYLTNLADGLPTLHLPKDEHTLLAVEHSAGYSLRLLDGKGGLLTADVPEFVETTVQAYTPDVKQVATRVEGVIALDSGISAALPVKSKNSWLHQEKSETGFPTTKAILRFSSKTPVAAVVRDDTEPGRYAVVPLTIDKHHNVILWPSRSLSVRLMDESGQALPESSAYRITLKWVDKFGLKHAQTDSDSTVLFRSVPVEGAAELTIAFPDGAETRFPIELPEEDLLAIAVERPEKGPMHVTTWPGVMPEPRPAPTRRGRLILRNGVLVPLGGRQIILPNQLGGQQMRLPGPKLNIRRPLPAVLPPEAPAYVPKPPTELNPLFVPQSDPLIKPRVRQ